MTKTTFVTAAVVLLFAAPALAVEPGAPTRLIDHDTAVSISVQKTLSVQDAVAGDDYATKAGKDLMSFYSDRGNRPLWVTQEGFTPRARQVIEEIRRAGDYGLDRNDFDLPRLDGASGRTFTVDHLASIELAISRQVLKYARHAKGGRIDPTRLSKYLDRGAVLPEPSEIMLAVASTGDAGAVLRGLHPKHPQFEKLRQKYLALRGDDEPGADVTIPDGPTLREGDVHEQVSLLRERLSIPEPQGAAGDELDASTFDGEVAEAVRKFQESRGLKVDGIVGPGTRRALNRTDTDRLLRLIVNMERLRWMPENPYGDSNQYVWVNIPEYRVRMVRDEKVVLSERAVIGKLQNQTPVFSDEIEWVEFHPVWYMPNSIKVSDILPSLKHSDRVLERYDLKLNCPKGIGRVSSWGGASWQGDIRRCSVTQRPSAKNVLGYFKFKLPNKHAVYLHDTPERNLFGTTQRTYSHGCIRVQHPERLAASLFENDGTMSMASIKSIVAGPRKTQTRHLKVHVPVHMTYLTARVTDDGQLQFYGDIYGHDHRISRALTGKATSYVARAASPPPRTSSAQVANTTQTSTRTWRQRAFSPR